MAAHGSRGPWHVLMDKPARSLHVLVLLVVLVLNLLQQPGRITFDSKLDLQFSPVDFLARSLSLWNPDAAFGF